MKIKLRPVTQNDARLIVKWRNSANVKNHCFSKRLITEESHAEFYKNNVLSGNYIQYIVERIDDNFRLASYPISTVYLKDIDNENHRCQLCIFTSDDVEWDEKCQSEAIRILLDEAFNKLNMHKVYSYVFCRYMNEVHILERSGFNLEAILKDEAMVEDGKYEDIYRMSIFRTETKNK